MTERFDVIGDIHGHADALMRLLSQLGYAESDHVYRHPDRRVIFVGDFIDRGPDQTRVLTIARRMCEAGTALAVMGNHEFNALGWATPDGEGSHLRPHTQKNTSQHVEFLNQIGENSADHAAALAWFRTLPVWLEFPGLRAIHACWHDPSRAALADCLDGANRFTDEGLRRASRKGSPAYNAAEVLLKGPELDLPAGKSFHDKDGHERTEVRIRWWDSSATTFKTAALGMDERLDELPDGTITAEYRYEADRPVLFGHYWLTDLAKIGSGAAMCLDHSVAKSGRLLAYRWSGERALSLQNVVSVPA